MSNGVVKWFNKNKGYGFISSEDEKDVFVHFSSIRGKGYRVLEEGDEVVFDLMPGPKGPQATNVRRARKGELEELEPA
ncbi:MAG: cold-shock protein [bacterium]|nr:cold-shock protein [bacterium]